MNSKFTTIYDNCKSIRHEFWRELSRNKRNQKDFFLFNWGHFWLITSWKFWLPLLKFLAQWWMGRWRGRPSSDEVQKRHSPPENYKLIQTIIFNGFFFFSMSSFNYNDKKYLLSHRLDGIRRIEKILLEGRQILGSFQEEKMIRRGICWTCNQWQICDVILRTSVSDSVAYCHWWQATKLIIVENEFWWIGPCDLLFGSEWSDMKPIHYFIARWISMMNYPILCLFGICVAALNLFSWLYIAIYRIVNIKCFHVAL